MTSPSLVRTDFIYADVPYFAGIGVDQFQKRYRQTFASPEVKALVEKVPMVGIFDDHEIYNDYSANASSPSYAPAMQAYQEYVGAANYDPVEPGVHYYDFRCVPLSLPSLSRTPPRVRKLTLDPAQRRRLGLLRLGHAQLPLGQCQRRRRRQDDAR